MKYDLYDKVLLEDYNYETMIVGVDSEDSSAPYLILIDGLPNHFNAFGFKRSAWTTDYAKFADELEDNTRVAWMDEFSLTQTRKLKLDLL